MPKGIQPGQVIRLSGQGNGGGNLLLEIEYAAHPQFEVDGRNILYTLQVMPWQAALGTTISVPTLGGAVELKVPADSEAGRKLRLRGRGPAGRHPGRPDRGAGNPGPGAHRRGAEEGVSDAGQGLRRIDLTQWVL